MVDGSRKENEGRLEHRKQREGSEGFSWCMCVNIGRYASESTYMYTHTRVCTRVELVASRRNAM